MLKIRIMYDITAICQRFEGSAIYGNEKWKNPEDILIPGSAKQNERTFLKYSVNLDQHRGKNLHSAIFKENPRIRTWPNCMSYQNTHSELHCPFGKCNCWYHKESKILWKCKTLYLFIYLQIHLASIIQA